MRKKLKLSSQWYIYILSPALLIFSLLCWVEFAEKFYSVYITDGQTPESEVTSEVKPAVDPEEPAGLIEIPEEKVATAASIEAPAEDLFFYCSRIDDAMDLIESKWYGKIYQKWYLCKVDTLFTYYTTGEIASSEVTLGSNNWMFFISPSDGNSVADFEGTNRYSADEMQSILDNALWTQSELESRGIKSAIVVAPNKENIYAEFMPDRYRHAEVSSTDLLIDYLHQNGVNMISPKAELLAAHSDTQLYYSYDTHWNQQGAYIAVRKLLSSWGYDMPALSERSISTSALSSNYHYGGDDDLAKILGLREVFNDETEYEIDGTCLMDWDTYEEEQNDFQVSYYSNPEAEIQESLLLVGDSFRSAMIPALREMFANVYVVHRDHYTAELLTQINPDYLCSVYAERYSSQMEDITYLIP